MKGSTITVLIVLCLLLAATGIGTAYLLDDKIIEPSESSTPTSSSQSSVEPEQKEEESQQLLLCVTEAETDKAKSLLHFSVGEESKLLTLTQISNDILDIPVKFGDDSPLSAIKSTLLDTHDLAADEWVVITTDAIDSAFKALGDVTLSLENDITEQDWQFTEGENNLSAEKASEFLVTSFKTEPMMTAKYLILQEYLNKVQGVESFELMMLAYSLMSEVKLSIEQERLLNILTSASSQVVQEDELFALFSEIDSTEIVILE